MSITFYRTPRLLLEAVELLFVYANQLPVRSMTKEDRQYCVPVAELEKIMGEACGSIALEDETLRFFFQRYSLPRTSAGSHTCLARLLIFSFSDVFSNDLDGVTRSIACESRRMMEERFLFENLDDLTISFRPYDGSQAMPFANGLGQLAAPTALKEKILDVFSNPEPRLAALGELLRPVMDHLGRALAPWAAQAEPLADVWQAQLRAQSLNQLLSDKLHCKVDWPVSSAETALLYFVPDRLIFWVKQDKPDVKLLVGVGCELAESGEPFKFAGWEYQALRLLGSPARMRMISAMCERPMSSRELAKSLGIHLGTVSRDVNSMREAQLLKTEFDNNRRRYSVNYAALRTIARHLVSMCPEEPPDWEK